MESTELQAANRSALPSPLDIGELPTLVTEAGANARYAYAEFFGDQIDNAYTRRAYRHAVHRFLAWCERQSLQLDRIPPGAIGQYIRTLAADDGRSLAAPTQKLHLAAIRRFFDVLVQRHAIILNPAASVRGPRLKVTEGKTPAAHPADVRKLLESIDLSRPIGLRDRAILATMIYTACRVGAVAKLRRNDFTTDGRQWHLRFNEKGGNQRLIPCRFDLQGYIEAYLTACPTPPGSDNPLFRSAAGRTGQLTANPCQPKDLHRMLKRRLAGVGLPTLLTCHSFRTTTATDLLEQGVPIDDVQQLLGHADPRTTRLYDRREQKVTRNLVERISI